VCSAARCGCARVVGRRCRRSPPLTRRATHTKTTKQQPSLDVIGKLLYNCAVSPREDKFRSIKLSNAKVRAAVVDAPGALDALKAFGWVESAAGDELGVAPGTFFTMKDVRVVDAAKERLRKELEQQKKKALRESSSGGRLSGLVPAQA
jgi:hypothetical protein